MPGPLSSTPASPLREEIGAPESPELGNSNHDSAKADASHTTESLDKEKRAVKPNSSDQEAAPERQQDSSSLVPPPKYPEPETDTPVQGDEPPKPSKKRGRPSKTDEDPTGTAPKTKRSKKPSTDTKETKAIPPAKEKKKATPKSDGSKSSGGKGRGRPAGGGGGGSNYTPEQEAYIRKLFSGPTKLSLKDAHQQFEEIFNTGKSENSLRFCWYRMKNEGIVLGAEDEKRLRDAIKLVTLNPAVAVLKEYGEGGTKLKQGYVSKKMKEWEAEKHGNGALSREDGEGEQGEGSEGDE